MILRSQKFQKYRGIILKFSEDLCDSYIFVCPPTSQQGEPHRGGDELSTYCHPSSLVLLSRCRYHHANKTYSFFLTWVPFFSSAMSAPQYPATVPTGEGDNGVGYEPVDNGPPGYQSSINGGIGDMGDKTHYSGTTHVQHNPAAVTDQDLLGGMQHQPDASMYGGGGTDMAGPQQGGGDGHQPYAEGEDDDEYEDPEEMIKEFGRHPMMDRVQEALYNQLLQTYERVSEELRDKNADVKK